MRVLILGISSSNQEPDTEYLSEVVRMWLLTSTKAKFENELSVSSSLTTFIIYYFTFSQRFELFNVTLNALTFFFWNDQILLLMLLTTCNYSGHCMFLSRHCEN